MNLVCVSVCTRDLYLLNFVILLTDFREVFKNENQKKGKAKGKNCGKERDDSPGRRYQGKMGSIDLIKKKYIIISHTQKYYYSTKKNILF